MVHWRSTVGLRNADAAHGIHCVAHARALLYILIHHGDVTPTRQGRVIQEFSFRCQFDLLVPIRASLLGNGCIFRFRDGITLFGRVYNNSNMREFR